MTLRQAAGTSALETFRLARVFDETGRGIWEETKVSARTGLTVTPAIVPGQSISILPVDSIRGASAEGR